MSHILLASLRLVGPLAAVKNTTGNNGNANGNTGNTNSSDTQNSPTDTTTNPSDTNTQLTSPNPEQGATEVADANDTSTSQKEENSSSHRVGASTDSNDSSSTNNSNKGAGKIVELGSALANGASPAAIIDAIPQNGIGKLATELGNRMARENPTIASDISNATRHAYWQAELTRVHGVEQAIAIGNAHEVGITPDSPLWPDSQRDLYNNVIGRDIGSQSTSPEMTESMVIEAWNNGTLARGVDDPRINPGGG
ncbi:MAG: hypothetical protein MI748_12820 [Opitutales bacterium]|nr:hypothetical protein [Opitutales bacterium]